MTYQAVVVIPSKLWWNYHRITRISCMLGWGLLSITSQRRLFEMVQALGRRAIIRTHTITRLRYWSPTF